MEAVSILAKAMHGRGRVAMVALAASFLAAPAISSCASAQDATAGERVFALCRACHQVGPSARNGVGPVLNGIVGRPAGTVPDYDYTEANRTSGLVWDEPTLREYLKDPKAKIPGTKMIFLGIKRDRQIEDLIAFLKQYTPNGTKLP